MKVWLLLVALLILTVGCSENSSTAYILEENDLSIDKEEIDFGSSDSLTQLSINIKSGKKLKWMLSKTADNQWLEIDLDNGYESAIVNISIDRNYLPIGVSADSLTLTGISAITDSKLTDSSDKSKEIVKKIAIKVERKATYIDLLNQIIGNEVFLPPNEISSGYSFQGSFQIEKGNTVKTAFSTYYFDKQFSEISDDVIFNGKNINNSIYNVSLKKNSFNYTTVDSSSYNAVYYLAENNIYENNKSDFDNSTFHKFSFSNLSIDSLYGDRILSVSSPNWKNPAFLVSKSSDLIVQWSSTAPLDDIIFVVLASKSDTSVKVMPTAPVYDTNEIITIPKEHIAKLALAGSEGVLWLVRYRINRDASIKKIAFVQAQSYYTFKIN